jgi:hypothetical protein
MPTITVDSILARAGVLLQDITNVRWPLSELLDWLNDGQRDIVLKKPNASVKNVAFALASGTKQTLPADAVQLIDVVRNVPGSVVRIVAREILDAQLPNWHGAAAQTVVQHYCYSELDLRHFYVYPPNTGTGNVEVIYSAAPVNAAQGGVISLDDLYQSALLDYILYRAFSKDAEYAADPARANAYYLAFANALGLKVQSEMGTSPNQMAVGNPNVLRHPP